MMRVEEVTDGRDLHRYRDEWRALAVDSNGKNLFLTYEWLTTWLEAFWKDKPIAFLFLRNGDTLVGLAPLLRDDAGELWCSHSLVLPVNPHTPRSDLLCSGDRKELLAVLFAYLRNTRKSVRLALTHLDGASSAMHALPEVAQDYHMTSCLLNSTTWPILRITSDWETYLKSRSSHFQREYRRKTKNLERIGRVDWVRVTSRGECDAAMDDIFQIERNSWKEEAGTSFTAETGLVSFYRELARTCSEDGRLRIHLLYLDSKPLAHIYGMVYENVYFALKTSYDQTFRNLAPGIVLFGYALREAFELRFEAFDFLGQPSRWKNEMATDCGHRVDLCVYSRNLGRCRCCQMLQQNLKPFIKRRIPFAITVTKALANTIKSVRPTR